MIISESLPQDDINSSFAWFMSYLENTDEKITNSHATEESYKTRMDAINSYGISGSYIKQRRWYTFPSAFVNDKNAMAPMLYPEFPETKALHMGQRMDLYKEVVSKVVEEFYEGQDEPDHIIHVSCSGYTSPNPVEKYVAKKKWGTMVTNCYHMGCYAAFPAVRMGLGFMHSFGDLNVPMKKLDILHTEFLSLHFGETRGAFTAGDIVNYSLFGDGYVKYSLYAESAFNEVKKSGLKVLTLKENIIQDSEDEMTWDLGIEKFDMYLSKYVPLFIKKQIKVFIKALFQQANLDFETIKDEVFCAIHPGGPKILRHIQEELELSDAQMKHSYAVFYNNGNMSSCTTPYIWKEIIDDNSIKKGSIGFSVAFGPGLTATALLFEKV